MGAHGLRELGSLLSRRSKTSVPGVNVPGQGHSDISMDIGEKAPGTLLFSTRCQ